MSEPDLQGLRSGGQRSWPRVVAWVLGILAVTVLLAFYLPLSSAHGELLAQHKAVVEKAKELEKSVLQANTALRAAEARRDELEAHEQKKQAQAAALKQRSESVRTALTAVLQKRKGGAALGSSPDSVVVALADTLVFAPGKLEVKPDGQQLLCELQKASGGRPLTVTAQVDPKAAIPGLKQKYPEIWGLSGARAASVAEVLESKCGAQRAKLSTGTLPPGASKATFDGAKPGPAQVSIEIDFTE
jgi:flagellar motor protein MotB